MNPAIGIIGEGPTDQATIRAILESFTENKDLDPRMLQPKPSETGNWDKVFQYCRSSEFIEAFEFLDFIIIQVDTDFLHGDSVPEDLRLAGIHNMTTIELVNAVKEKLVSAIGELVFAKLKEKIIFAISVNSIECWFLPIYFGNNETQAAKTKGCIELLNKELTKRSEPYINEKDPRYYQKLCKPFKKKANLLAYSLMNESFDIFIQELDAKWSHG